MTMRVASVVAEEVNDVQPLLQFAVRVSGAIPDLVGNRIRTSLFRICGMSIGDGTVIGGKLTIAGSGRVQNHVTIGARSWINAGCYFDASDRIDIGDSVALGQQVLILTQTHEIGPTSRRAGLNVTAPVSIGSGCWIGARAVILPGVTLGDGVVIGAGSVVTKDVPDDTLFAGTPARHIRQLA